MSVVLALAGNAQAYSPGGLAAATRAAPPAAAKANARTAPAVVTSTGAGQAGYVHFWIITAPDGEREIQVGMELADRRIAWSFPGVGGPRTPGIARGGLGCKGRGVKIEKKKRFGA